MAGRIIVPEGRLAHKTVDSKLEKRKDNIRDSYSWFRDNYKRSNYFRKFVFVTSLSDNDRRLMSALGKPLIEFNILEPYVSRQRGEFAKQEPSVKVGNKSALLGKPDPDLERIIEDHFRAIIDNSNRDNMAYDTFTDLCAGGFSSWRIYTEYCHNETMDQEIKWRRTYDPTLTGFDKNARESHKGDGNFAFEIYPKNREDFEREYGNKYTENMRFSRSELGGFNWSYSTEKNEEIVLMCDYFEKRITKEKRVQLLDGQVMSEEDYEEYLELWAKSGQIMQPPTIVDRRTVDVVNIDQYIIVENDIISYEQTDYKYLPIIFIDGNSIWYRDGLGNASIQFTKPMVYHAEGIQKLKNFAGITLANELENMVQHKFVVQEEAIPAAYTEAYTNVQKPNTLIYKGFKNDDPNIPLQAPQPIPRVPAPPELMNTFSMSDEMTQSILGSYDAVQGMQSNDVSGAAIRTGAIQGNATSMPYIIGYLRGLNRACDITLDLIPKYYDTPRSIPVKGIDGKRDYVVVNKEGSPSMDYEPHNLNVSVEAGVNFEVQRAQALDMLTNLMKISPLFAELISTEEAGLQMLLDNVDIRGVDALKQIVTEFIAKKKQQLEMQQKMQQQQMQMQMAQQQQMMQINPMQVEMGKVSQKAEEAASKERISQRELDIKEQGLRLQEFQTIVDASEIAAKLEMSGNELEAEQARTMVDAIRADVNQEHSHSMDYLELHHKVNSDERKHEQQQRKGD